MKHDVARIKHHVDLWFKHDVGSFLHDVDSLIKHDKVRGSRTIGIMCVVGAFFAFAHKIRLFFRWNLFWIERIFICFVLRPLPRTQYFNKFGVSFRFNTYLAFYLFSHTAARHVHTRARAPISFFLESVLN